MAITGRPRPLPECKGCGAPTKRDRWMLTGGKCSECCTTTEILAAGQRERRVAKLAEGSTTLAAAERKAQTRIEALAARRAARSSGA